MTATLRPSCSEVSGGRPSLRPRCLFWQEERTEGQRQALGPSEQAALVCSRGESPPSSAARTRMQDEDTKQTPGQCSRQVLNWPQKPRQTPRGLQRQLHSPGPPPGRGLLKACELGLHLPLPAPPTCPSQRGSPRRMLQLWGEKGRVLVLSCQMNGWFGPVPTQPPRTGNAEGAGQARDLPGMVQSAESSLPGCGKELRLRSTEPFQVTW